MVWEKRTRGKSSVVKGLHVKTATAACELKNALNLKCSFQTFLKNIFPQKMQNITGSTKRILIVSYLAFDNTLTTNSDFVKMEFMQRRQHFHFFFSHIYSNYAHNSREAVKMIAEKERKKDP